MAVEVCFAASGRDRCLSVGKGPGHGRRLHFTAGFSHSWASTSAEEKPRSWGSSSLRCVCSAAPLPVFSVPWGVAEPAGRAGRPSCLVYISELTALICHTPSSSRAVLHRFLISSQHTECCCCAVVPQSPSSPVLRGCTGWMGTMGSGLCGRGAAVTAAVTALPFTGDPRLGRTQSWAAGRGPGALGERCGFPGH